MILQVLFCLSFFKSLSIENRVLLYHECSKYQYSLRNAALVMTATLGFFITNSRKNTVLQLILCSKFRLLRSGDIELNPGPLKFENAIIDFRLYQDNLKFLIINCTSLHEKREGLKTLLKQMDNNFILGFTDTWLGANDSDLIWNVDNEKHKIIRSDRSPTKVKKTRWWSYAYCSDTFSPDTILKIVKRSYEKFYGSLWIDVICSGEPSLLNITYNPQKSYSSIFLDLLIVMAEYNG